MIYIFSNAHKYSIVNDYHLALQKKFYANRSNDKIFFLNDAIPYVENEKYWQDFKNIYVVLREYTFGIKSYFGLETIFKHKRNIISQIFMLDNNGTGIYFCPTKQDVHSKFKIKNFEYPNGKFPTTGFYAIFLAQTLFPYENIILVNFYGSNDTSTPKDCSHNWQYEENFLKTKHHIFI